MIEGGKDIIDSIPKGWKVCKLGELGEFKNGINKGKEDFGHGFPMVNLSNVFGVSSVKNENLGLVNSTPNERIDYALKQGDVLFIRSSVKPSGVGLTAVITENFIDTVYSGFIIRFRDENVLNLDFKKHCFYDSGFRNRLLSKSSISANTNINQKSLNSLSLLVPPLPEQQKIAEILSTVDAKIDLITQRISQTQDLKKGLMQRLLTKGIGHTEFKDSPLGEIPKSWEVVKIGDIGQVITGSTPKTSIKEYYCDKGVLWASPADLGNSKYIEITKKQLTEIGFEQTRKLPPKSIMITCIGSTIGKIGMTNSWMSTNQQINSVNCNENNISEFYYYVMEFMATYIKSLAGTQAVPLLNKTDFSAIKVVKPPKQEQTQIANILSTVDSKLDALQNKKTHYQDLKKGLMQQLLTGKVRVNGLIKEVV